MPNKNIKSADLKVRMPAELKEKFTKITAERYTNPSEVTRQLIAEYVKQHEEKPQ